MANRFYNEFLQALGDGDIDLGAGTFKLALVSSAYTPNTAIAGDEFESDLAGVLDEVDLVTPTWSGGIFDAADLVATFTDSNGGTGVALVLYKDTGTPATSRLIMIFDTLTGLPILQDGTDDTVTFDASGIFKLIP